MNKRITKAGFGLFLAVVMVFSPVFIQEPIDVRAADDSDYSITETQYRCRNVVDYEEVTTTTDDSPGSDYTLKDTETTYGEWSSWSEWSSTQNIAVAVTALDLVEEDSRNVDAVTKTKYQYSRYYGRGSSYYLAYPYSTGVCTNFETTAFLDNPLPVENDGDREAYGRGYDGYGNNTGTQRTGGRWDIWWYNKSETQETVTPAHTEYRYRTRDKEVTYIWQKPVWGEWSDWRTMPYLPSDTTQVETRQVEVSYSVDGLSISIPDMKYTGSALEPEVTVKHGTTTLEEGTDYTLSYSNNVNAGQAKVTVTGLGYYSGTRTEYFTIGKASIINDVSTMIAGKCEYTGSAITPDPIVYSGDVFLKKDKDYTLTYYNNTNVGTARAVLTGIGNYSGTNTLTFTITPISVTTATVTEVKARLYTGSAIAPAVVVKVGDKKLVKGKDCVVDYIQNVNVGTATIRITGKGNYTGVLKKTFKILPKGTSVRALTPGDKAFTVRWDKQSTTMKNFHITGYQIQCSTDRNFAKSKKTVTVAGYSKTTTTVSKLKSNTTYYIRVRTYRKLNSGNYYSPWSSGRMIRTR